MKKLLLFLVVYSISVAVFSQSPTINSRYNKYTGTNWFTKALNIMGSSLTNTKINAYDNLVSKAVDTIPAEGNIVLVKDSVYQKRNSYTTRYDFKYEPTNFEQWKLWKKGGADISPLMPTYPITNVGATTMTDGRLYLYRFYTPDTTTIHGFRIIMSTAGSYTGDNYNGIYLYRYSNDSIYAIGNTTNAANFWTSTANTSVDKALAANVTIPPGFYAVAPIYNNSAQTTAPSIESSYISAIGKCVTFTGGWRTASYINTVTTPATSYKYSGSVSGESVSPHIILVY